MTHLVDELQAALVLGALVGELDGVQRKGRGGGEHDRGGGGEGRSLRVGTKHESVSGQSSDGAIPRRAKHLSASDAARDARIRPALARSIAFIFFHSFAPAFRGADRVDAREIGLDHRSETDRERLPSRVALIGNHQSTINRFGSVGRSLAYLVGGGADDGGRLLALD